MMSQEENGVMLTEFLEKSDSLVLVIFVNQQGQLTPINDFPATSKNKVHRAISCKLSAGKGGALERAY